MEGYKCNIGKGILKICMGDNYTDATVVFREYVQNAIDAIYQAANMLYSTTEDRGIHVGMTCWLSKHLAYAPEFVV